MDFCLFIQFVAPERDVLLAPCDREAIVRLLRSVVGLQLALVHAPAVTQDPYLDDGTPPPLALQLYYENITSLEATLGPSSALHGLADPNFVPSLAGARGTQQVMLVRRFAVPTPRPQNNETDTRSSYLVAYDGTAADPPVWLAGYLLHHPKIMARFPGVREVEVYTRLDWTGGIGLPRTHYLQRNKVVFDSEAALTAALQSQVRHEMRADFEALPPFIGRNTHYPMLTTAIRPRPSRRTR